MSRPTDQDLDNSVAAMLRIGVSIAALVVFAGGVLLLRHPGSALPDYHQFQEGNPALRTLSGIFEGAIDLAPKSIIQLGLLILIGTPIARVVLCVIGFARQRSAMYVAISALVLGILLFSIFHALR